VTDGKACMRSYADISLIGDIVEQGNLVIVGMKPTMNYVVACITLFNEGVPIATLMARGRSIPIAVDRAEMLRRVFLRDAHITNISIGRHL